MRILTITAPMAMAMDLRWTTIVTCFPRFVGQLFNEGELHLTEVLEMPTLTSFLDFMLRQWFFSDSFVCIR